MQYLPLPVSAADDEAVVNRLAKVAPHKAVTSKAAKGAPHKAVVNKVAKGAYWAPHRAAWIAAYQTYQANGGSPFVVVAHDFGPGVGDLQYELYDKRKNSGELKRMREKTGLKSCPVCGSPVTGSLDHYLPRASYPEFSIMRANLVPACMHCNSGSKGETVHGGDPKRFIHPYYDSWAAGTLWSVEVAPPYKAATFTPRPMAGLPAPQNEIVAFHLKNVLGTQFALSMATHWSTLPGQVKLRDSALTTESVTAQLHQELRVALHSGGDNCWMAALLRGILANNDAIEYVRLQAIVAPMPPLASAV